SSPQSIGADSPASCRKIVERSRAARLAPASMRRPLPPRAMPDPSSCAPHPKKSQTLPVALTLSLLVPSCSPPFADGIRRSTGERSNRRKDCLGHRREIECTPMRPPVEGPCRGKVVHSSGTLVIPHRHRGGSPLSQQMPVSTSQSKTTYTM